MSLDLSDNNCFEEAGFSICTEITYTFNSDGTLTSSFLFSAAGFTDTTVEEYTYTTDGGIITVCDLQEECSSASYDISGNLLSFSYIDEIDCNNNVTAIRQ